MWYCHNQLWIRSSKEGTEASRSRRFKNRQEWGKKCFEDLDQRRMGLPATRPWSTDFLLLEGSSREEIRKCLKNKSIPWQLRRRLLQVVTGTCPCGQQIQKYGYRRTTVCMLCQKAYEECGSSWKGELQKKTICHNQIVGCLLVHPRSRSPGHARTHIGDCSSDTNRHAAQAGRFGAQAGIARILLDGSATSDAAQPTKDSGPQVFGGPHQSAKLLATSFGGRHPFPGLPHILYGRPSSPA